MNIIMPPLNQSSRKRGSQRCQFSASVGFLALLVFLISGTVVAEEDAKPPATNAVETQMTENAGQKADTAGNTDTTSEMQKEKITGTADRMERYDKDGITILIGNAKTVRYNAQGVEIGFLNADKITMKSDPEIGTTTEIIAEGNVEIRDQDIFATCDHAIMNNLTNIITLKENVVVLQNKDRLETKLFTFNRTTGKQTGEGGVKFKVSVTQAAPVTAETDENSESSEGADEEKTAEAAPEKTETKAEEDKKDTDTETDDADADGEDKSDADTGNAEDADSQEETDTDTENPDDADADAETDESEND
ncbi:MAG: LPS export ABC transporter periplasmic protein LptC [Candidatus Poribacteria bacterium]|nr:LPS export ABC transporter periplasmic protein LptC [Candidatus Poribacteria bacterium]